MDKHRFRLGSTSYVYPDTMLRNVEKCAGVFQDMELIFFESEDGNNWPTMKEVKKIALMLQESGTTVTVHFPIDAKAASIDINENERFKLHAKRLIELTRELNPYAFILHLEGILPGANEKEIADWHYRSESVAGYLQESLSSDSFKIAVENLNYPWEWNLKPVRNNGFSFCLDFGHFGRYGIDWRAPFAKLLSETRVIHLHGWNGKNDHVSLEEHDRRELQELAKLLKKSYSGVISLELFETRAVFDSKKLWEELCR